MHWRGVSIVARLDGLFLYMRRTSDSVFLVSQLYVFDVLPYSWFSVIILSLALFLLICTWILPYGGISWEIRNHFSM